MPVALVTDSTASITPEVARSQNLTVVPLQVIIGATTYDEGADGATPEMVAEALQEYLPVSTSRPNPDEMLAAYERLAGEGATTIVSVHLSGELSGTYESALLAARRAPVPVLVVDSRQVGMATGFAVLAAARAAADGADGETVARIAKERAGGTTALFYVDTLEFLRRGGRVGAVGALLGSALAVKPILEIQEGRIVPKERVRTAGKALARLADLAIEAAGDDNVQIAVAHLGAEQRADQLAERLADALGDQIDGDVHLGEVGAVLGAHVGPGMVAACVSPC